jgi:hypothetical protein
MSAGSLTEEEVERIRTRKIADPTVGQVAALASRVSRAEGLIVVRLEPL